MPTCTVCGHRPVDTPAAYACPACTTTARTRLDQIADTTPAARDVATGATRRGTPTRGSSGSRLPLDLGAQARLDAAQAAITTWARHVRDDLGATVTDHGDPLITAARYLAAHLDWIRHERYVDEAYRDIHAAARVITGIVDRPTGQVLVGACDCGTVLYAKATAATIACRHCARRWDVAGSRDTLRQALDDKLATAAQIAGLAITSDPDLDRQRVRRTINVWGHRGPDHGGIETRGHSASGDPLYRVGDVIPRVLAAHAGRAA